MEFLSKSEVMGLLQEHGITAEAFEDGRVYLRMKGGADVVRLSLAASNCTAPPPDGMRVIKLDRERLPAAIDRIIHKLHLTEIVLFPVGKWRSVFDAVAFSMADNEDWREFDTAATVELNTRDPLMCEPGDFQTVRELVRALLSDAESPEQGLIITSTAAPLLVEIVPEGSIRVSFGTQVMADEVAETFEQLGLGA